MSLNDLLNEKHHRASHLNTAVDLPLKYLEIWTYQNSDVPTIREDDLRHDDLEDWLHQRKIYAVPVDSNGHKAMGLRLLIPKWWHQFDTPCTSQTLDDIIKALQLPRSYPSEITIGHYVPTQLQRVVTATGANIGIVCQSPNFIESFLTMALSYDPIQHITSGILAHRAEKGNDSPIYDLLSDLKGTSLHASHPMLLPLLILRRWYFRLYTHHDEIGQRLKAIQRDTGQMKNYFRKANSEESFDQFINFDKIHTRIVEEHVYVSNSISDFVEELSAGFLNALDEIGDKRLSSSQIINKVHDEDLRAFALQMQRMVKVELRNKDRLLSRLDMQLKVLYTLMQQRDSRVNYEIAVATKRDSSVMKSIALLTMVFLPGTAIASIFSMSPFFASSVDSKVTVSSQFWIYWVVTIPLTIVVLGCFLLWLQQGPGTKPSIYDSKIAQPRIHDNEIGSEEGKETTANMNMFKVLNPSIRQEYHSAPVMAENSLGWN